MRKIIEAVGTVVAVVIAAAFIWFALSAPGFTVDEANRGAPRGAAMIDAASIAPRAADHGRSP